MGLSVVPVVMHLLHIEFYFDSALVQAILQYDFFFIYVSLLFLDIHFNVS